ncbi:MAG TPA: hypothetical protein VK139_04720 [Microbacteriaceae bacterium]|nr:hypothetical protein [Microbacteriaceae bacterium]
MAELPEPMTHSMAGSRRRSRHGRALRSSVVGKFLPPVRTRRSTFDAIVTQTADWVRGTWPIEMTDVTIYVAAAPAEAIHGDHIDRWKIDQRERSVTLFWMPIARFDFRSSDTEVERRMLIEGLVFRALADLLGKDPWELARSRFGQ